MDVFALGLPTLMAALRGPALQISVQNQSQRPRNDSTLVVPFPKPFDIKDDILKPGVADNFVRELNAALDTRGLFEHIVCSEPTLHEIHVQNPMASAEEVQVAFDTILADRATVHRQAASILPTVLKHSSLTLSEMEEINALADVTGGAVQTR